MKVLNTILEFIGWMTVPYVMLIIYMIEGRIR